MSAPDRPTREQVDAALARVDVHAMNVTATDVSVLAAEVRALRAELEPYEMLAAQDCPAGKHAEWLIDSEHNHACPWCQIESLRAALVARTPQPAEPTTFEIDGVIRSQARTPEDDPRQRCLCCQPRGHVFSFGVDLPYERISASGSIPASPSDWISKVLYAHRFEGGRKVRLTLILLDPADDNEPSAPAAPLPAVPDGEDDRRQAVLDRQRGELAWGRWLSRAAEKVRRARSGPGEAAAVADLIRVLDTPRPSVEGASWSARDDGGCIHCDSTGPHVPLTSCGECGVTWLRADVPVGAPVGEDVPARLDAAVEALAEFGMRVSARGLRDIAVTVKHAPPEARAALASALAHVRRETSDDPR